MTSCTYCTNQTHKATWSVRMAGVVEHVCSAAYGYIHDRHSIDGTLDQIETLEVL